MPFVMFAALIPVIVTLTTFVRAFPQARPSEILIAAPISFLNTTTPLVITAQQPVSSPPPGRALKVQCDADLYGNNLNVRSCTNVFGYMNKEDKIATFA